MNAPTSRVSVIQRAVASAPGKAILFGEHAVVYGTNAIAGSLSDMRIFVEAATVAGDRTISVSFRDIKDAATGEPVQVAIDFDILKDVVSGGEDPTLPAPPSDEERAHLQETFASNTSVNPSSDGAVSSGLMCVAYLASKLFGSTLLDRSSSSSSSSPFSNIGLQVTVKSHGLPIGAGLGSSAAFSVALAAAFLHLSAKLLVAQQLLVTTTATNNTDTIAVSSMQLIRSFGLELEEAGSGAAPAVATVGKLPAQAQGEGEGVADTVELESLRLINDWAYASEVLIHGSPSGLDNTTSCYGGLVRFSKAAGFETLGDSPSLHMLLVNTKVPRSTKQLVAGVRILRDAHPSVIEPIIQTIDNISLKFLELLDRYKAAITTVESSRKEEPDSIASSSYSTFVKEAGELITVNHHLLCALGVGHGALTAVVDAAAQASLPCKLTGAGGGGCAIVLSPVAFPDVDAGSTGSAAADGESADLLVDLKTQMFEVVHCLRAKGFELHRTAIGGDGVRLYI